MALKGKDSSGWKDASAVYGKDASGWLYAKEAWAKNASGWQRAWTDCRLYDAAGGRGWSDPVSVVTYTGTCGNRTATTTVTRTKTGCPNDVRATTVASPDCNSGCYDAPTVTEEYYDGSCSTRRLRTKTVTNPKTGSNCGSSTTYGDPYASPTCDGNPPGACWTEVTCSYAGQTNVTFAGQFFAEVYEIVSGVCFASKTATVGEYIYYFYTCQGTQGVYAAYIGG